MMKKRMGLLLGIVFVFGFAVVVFVRNEEKTDKKKEVNMREKENTRVVLDAFSAIERRDDQRLSELLDPDFEIHWPPSLPYGGISRGLDRKGPTWSETWIPLQPTEAERRMDPRVIAANGNEVVVCWRQRGVTPAGDRFDGEVLGLYKVGKGKLARAQMFYFDTAAVREFLQSGGAISQPNEKKTENETRTESVFACRPGSLSASQRERWQTLLKQLSAAAE
jgi:ketosteroid isomerase-like protein